ncbi:MAG: phosphoenolpyruvate synthase [Gammaproteobacteria bacterium]|nr:phosphoenolpyruvate synthase [Gammaproteobacteria bacterium]
MSSSDYIQWFDTIRMDDVDIVGGKNASLGEMYTQLTGSGVDVPNGFATTAQAYRDFLEQNNLTQRINQTLEELDVEDVVALGRTGAQVRQWVMEAELPQALQHQLTSAYQKLVSESQSDISVAIRSSATAEDLPEASFAGQQETLLNIRGEAAMIAGVKEVFASLYNDRAISYRVHQKFDHSEVALSCGIQRMARSDTGASGVMFTLDTESGFDKVVFITASYGLGETVVQGAVNPDEFYVHKPTLALGKQAVIRRNRGSKLLKMIYNSANHPPIETIDTSAEERGSFCLSDEQVLELARHAVAIEQHYGRPMDIEWALDGEDQKLYILQARPETVQSRSGNTLQRFVLHETAPLVTTGRSIGQRIASGPARVIASASQMDEVLPGEVLVTDMTDPDWEPIMKRASAIVTNRGGRTCHAAIIARELGIPAVVGTGDATRHIVDGQLLTVSCAEGDDGKVYEGLLNYEMLETNIENMPELPFKIMMNVGNPERAFDFASLPNAGVGLARLEFIINRMIGIHPKALLQFDQQTAELQVEITERIQGYPDPISYYVERLSEGVATIAAAFYPQRVIVRLSDFKSNEYANLLGGSHYEPEEENPMLGFRGASRYISDDFRDCFELECRAIHKVREEMGLSNVEIMIPFVRTVDEARQVIDILKENGLERGKDGLKIIMMCELPSNALLAKQFLQYFDGFSIGSNDLTQLTLGLDRDSGLIAKLFDERNDAVKALLHMAIKACKEEGKYVGICGQGPSDHPDFAHWLMDEGIDSVSLNPDSVVDTWLYLAKRG